MRRIVFLLLAAVATGVIALPLLAGEVPPVTPGEFWVSSPQASPEAHWVWSLLAWEAVAVVAGWVYLQISARFKDSRYMTAISAIKDAVIHCYHEYVRVIKAARADGKLTVAEKNEAVQVAYRAAVDFAKQRGVDLLKIFAKETIVRLIEKYVGESKLKAVVPPPLPDLAS